MTVQSPFTDRCTFSEYFHGSLWVGVTVESAFMGGCTYFEYIYGRVWAFVNV